MVADPALTLDPAGPLEPHAAREIVIAAAETARAAERSFRLIIWVSIHPSGSSLSARIGVQQSGPGSGGTVIESGFTPASEIFR
jgi:hypothetical protein